MNGAQFCAHLHDGHGHGVIDGGDFSEYDRHNLTSLMAQRSVGFGHSISLLLFVIGTDKVISK